MYGISNLSFRFSALLNTIVLTNEATDISTIDATYKAANFSAKRSTKSTADISTIEATERTAK
jgi:hypothetical protein